MTSWVTIDKEKCIACGICLMRCPLVFSTKDDEMEANADADRCNLCGHCVSLCPTDAIVHSKLDMDNFGEIDEPVTFEPDTFIQFIRQRRSHRHFKDTAIPREDLEKLVDTCRYAPTGSNVQGVEILVVQDPEKRQRLSDLTLDFFEDFGAHAAEAAEKLKAEGQPLSEFLKKSLRYRDRLGYARKMGFDAIFYWAPAVIIFHSAQGPSSPKDDCVIASTTMGLTARTMGLESTYIGLFEMASKGYEPLIEELALPPGHEVYSVLIMGYPRLKFLKTVDRKPIETRWE